MASGCEQTIDHIMERSHDLFRVLQSTTTAESLQLGLTIGQVEALFALAQDEPVTIGLLGQKLGIHLPAASHAADRLVTLGLAERCEDPDDRRRTFVHLTPRGSTLVEQLRQGKRDRFRAWLGRLDDDDLAALLRGLEAIASVAARR